MIQKLVRTIAWYALALSVIIKVPGAMYLIYQITYQLYYYLRYLVIIVDKVTASRLLFLVCTAFHIKVALHNINKTNIIVSLVGRPLPPIKLLNREDNEWIV